MQQESARKILAASFTTPDGGSRAAGALGGAMRDEIGNTAVLFVRPDGKAKFVESKDWGAGRGALLGGAIVVEDLDESVASLFARDAEPETEPEPAAVSSESLS